MSWLNFWAKHIFLYVSFQLWQTVQYFSCRGPAFLRREDGEQRRGSSYLELAAGAFVVIALFEWLWPNVIPFRMFQVWEVKGNLLEAVIMSWPLFLWGIALNFYLLFKSKNEPEVNRHAEQILVTGCGISVFAGFFEEVSFRWLIFFDSIIGYKLLNWLFFGWSCFGIADEWLYANIEAPLVNLITGGYFQPQLYSELGWAVGAAMLSSNGKFRDGHMYQGPAGWLNAWIAGMFFFYLMFHYGLLASILVHFLFDLAIFTLAYIDACIERKLGWV